MLLKLLDTYWTINLLHILKAGPWPKNGRVQIKCCNLPPEKYRTKTSFEIHTHKHSAMTIKMMRSLRIPCEKDFPTMMNYLHLAPPSTTGLWQFFNWTKLWQAVSKNTTWGETFHKSTIFSIYLLIICLYYIFKGGTTLICIDNTWEIENRKRKGEKIMVIIFIKLKNHKYSSTIFCEPGLVKIFFNIWCSGKNLVNNRKWNTSLFDLRTTILTK